MGKIILVGFLFLVACTKKDKTPLTPLESGRKLYSTHCIACHNPNIKLDGAVGPALAGASLELLQRRVLHGDYPAGYTAKRTTHIMPVLPFLKDDIPALHAYLNSP